MYRWSHGFGRLDGGVATDRVEHQQPVALQIPVYDFKEGSVVLHSHMFEHPQRHHMIERLGFVERTVIRQTDLHREPLNALPSVGGLFFGDGDSKTTASVAFGRESKEAPPAAADIQDSVTLLKPELSTDEVELGFLCSIECFCRVPVATRTYEATIEHGFEEVMAQVVVLGGLVGLRGPTSIDDEAGPTFRRASLDSRGRRRPPNAPADRRSDPVARRPTIHPYSSRRGPASRLEARVGRSADR